MIFSLKNFNPFNSFDYFREYFSDVRQIETNRKLRLNVFYVHFNNMFQVMILSAPFLFDISPWTLVLIMNTSHLFHLPNYFGLTVFPILYSLTCYTNMLYYGNRNELTDLIEDVVVHGKNDFFLFKMSDGKEVSTLAQKSAKLMMLMMNKLFLVVIGLYLCIGGGIT